MTRAMRCVLLFAVTALTFVHYAPGLSPADHHGVKLCVNFVSIFVTHVLQNVKNIQCMIAVKSVLKPVKNVQRNAVP